MSKEEKLSNKQEAPLSAEQKNILGLQALKHSCLRFALGGCLFEPRLLRQSRLLGIINKRSCGSGAFFQRHVDIIKMFFIECLVKSMGLCLA